MSGLKEIHEAWVSPDTPDETLDAIWSLQDGYGEPGYMPVQGYDWSGIRDSSDEAIAAMLAVVRNSR
jgi:hypothetical protein